MSTSTSVDRINYLNIVLMVGSLWLAFLAPFEVFLLSYAILGPLHYFTEISWLHRRQYFSPGKYDYLWLVALTLLLFATQFIVPSLSFTSATIVAFAFLGTLSFVVFQQRMYRFLALAVILLGIFFLSDFRWYFVLFAIFLTTLVHTFIFTGAFILQGALKKSTFSGLLSLVVFVGCAAACFLLVPVSGFSELSNYIQESYGAFWVINSELLRLLGHPFQQVPDLYQTSAALMVMRFIAFSYLYHFLNWFSKTSVIGWHRTSKPVLAGVVIAWLSCLGIYWYDYRLGLVVLYFFSMLHVFLEFPLNHQTFLAIGRAIAGKS